MEQFTKRHNFSKLRISLDGKYCKKVSFGTKKVADEYIAKLQKESTREKVPVNSYLCTKCNCWHLTSWEIVDISKIIKYINEEVAKIAFDYNTDFDKVLIKFKTIADGLEEVQIENSNLKLENYKLKHELDKLKKEL